MTDLKIIDELIILMKRSDQSFLEFENSYNITQKAMSRLRNAYLAGEMESITASLAIYFDRGEALDELTSQAQKCGMGYSEYDVMTNTQPYAEDLGLEEDGHRDEVFQRETLFRRLISWVHGEQAETTQQ